MSKKCVFVLAERLPLPSLTDHMSKRGIALFKIKYKKPEPVPCHILLLIYIFLCQDIIMCSIMDHDKIMQGTQPCGKRLTNSSQFLEWCFQSIRRRMIKLRSDQSIENYFKSFLKWPYITWICKTWSVLFISATGLQISTVPVFLKRF